MSTLLTTGHTVRLTHEQNYAAEITQLNNKKKTSSLKKGKEPSIPFIYTHNEHHQTVRCRVDHRHHAGPKWTSSSSQHNSKYLLKLNPCLHEQIGDPCDHF